MLNHLNISKDNFPSGIAIWGAFPPALTTRGTNLDTGVHVHARRIHSTYKDIDETFDSVYLTISTNKDIIEISAKAITAYDISALVGEIPIGIKCPRCNMYHTDTGEFSVRPHRKHLCSFCKKFFFSDQRCVGNELAHITPSNLRNHRTVNTLRSLNINEHYFSGGFDIWGWHKALLWSMEKAEEIGIHIHGYDDSGNRVMDDTFSTIIYNDTVIDVEDAQYLMMQKSQKEILTKIDSLKCPNCGLLHSDRGYFGFVPHCRHECVYCSKKFYTKRKVISNSLNSIINQ
ncbi:hypothetical protein KC685_05080 [Candidatus Dojkabacteria bacterium]|uniref:Uncharacterized protein n=1 Tax=Candidatus Dojkabacteria bacterium TaxID=2099670 RepID=A0A955I3S2_9BACT|nr:hypothetical protein [Candidatus Dojkabacteria bacterium]